MATWAWIVILSLATTLVAALTGLTLLAPDRRQARWSIPLVALGAGALTGGALFHLLPAAVIRLGAGPWLWAVVASGFVAFLMFDAFLETRRSNRHPDRPTRPLGVLILVADTVHNFHDGMAVGSALGLDVRLGLTTWLVVAAHELPQELADFAALRLSGWSIGAALRFNILSSLAFLPGAALCSWLSTLVETAWLMPFAAGSFLYVGAARLLPETTSRQHAGHSRHGVGWFLLALALLWTLAWLPAAAHDSTRMP